MMASKTMVLAPIISALVKTEDKLGANRVWQAINDLQSKFLKDFFSKRDELIKLNDEELRNWISDNADELNKVLKEEGFDIELQEFASNEFGVVSILDVMVEWLKKATETKMSVDGKVYPAVSMKSREDTEDGTLMMFETYVSKVHPNPIVCVNTKSGDKVFMTIATDEVGSFELVDIIDEIRGSEFQHSYYDTLQFPMIDYNDEVDISWLLGMGTVDEGGVSWSVSQAMQQTKFKMNHEGARVKSAVAVGLRMTCIQVPKILKIDKPFLLWIERDGLSIPIKYAYYDTDDWKNPGSLDM